MGEVINRSLLKSITQMLVELGINSRSGTASKNVFSEILQCMRAILKNLFLRAQPIFIKSNLRHS